MIILLIISLWLLINTWVSLSFAIYEQDMIDKFTIPILIICSVFSYPVVSIVYWIYTTIYNRAHKE